MSSDKIRNAQEVTHAELTADPELSSRRSFLMDTLALASVSAAMPACSPSDHSLALGPQETAKAAPAQASTVPGSTKQNAKLVLQGGGIFGIGLVGAVSQLEPNYNFLSCAGTSAGSIVASLLAAGYSTAELKDLINSIDFSIFKDAPTLLKTSVLGHAIKIPEGDPFYRLYEHLGVNPGNEFEKWIGQQLNKKGVHTFGDLRRKDGIASPGVLYNSYKLNMIATDVTRSRLLVLPEDLKEYAGEDGKPIEPDDFDVAKAIRMSISIPFFFEPVQMTHHDSKKTSLIMDGGVSSNFPIGLYSPPDEPSQPFPVFGVRFGASPKITSGFSPEYDKLFIKVGNETLGYNALYALPMLYETATQAWDNRFADSLEDQSRIAYIDTSAYESLKNVSVTSFGLSQQQKDDLYDAGVKAYGKSLKNYDHAKWVARHTLLVNAFRADHPIGH
jgi:NTE family protein